jgi:molybdate transport system substrate-binding protein
MSRVLSVAAAILFFASSAPGRSEGATLTILSPGSTEGAFTELFPQFEAASGHKIEVSYGPVGALAARVEKGQAADIVILSEPATKGLRRAGKLAPGTETKIAKVGIGVFVRKGDPKPDISSVGSFIQALTNAKFIAYADPSLGGSASILIGELMNSLDITGSIRAKTKQVPPAKPLLDLVASGAVDFGFNPVSETLLDSRLDLVGPLPAEIQNYTTYVASLVEQSAKRDAFNALIAFLSSAGAAEVFKRRGFELP